MKRFLCLMLVLLLLTGCTAKPQDSNGDQQEQNAPSEENILHTEDPEQAVRVKLELNGEAEALAEYAQTIMALRDEGVDFLTYGLVWPAEYSLCYALSCTGSLRYGVELLLEVRGEELKTDRYADWDTIGAISPVCPCPFQLEALVCEETGDTARAEACKEMAALNPQQVHGSEAFDILPTMSTEGLKELKAELETFEDHLLSLWSPEPVAKERCGYEFSAEYYQTCAAVALRAGDNRLALDFYEKALQTNPFLADSYAVCATQAIKLESPETVLAYLNGGLALDETHPGLNALAAAFWLSAGEQELYREHLDAARNSDRLTDEIAKFCDNLEGGIS